jgi:hypothetical protein
VKLTPDGESFLIHPARSCRWCSFRHVGRDCPAVRGEALARVRLMCLGADPPMNDERQQENAAKLAAAFDCLHFKTGVSW